ncbi:hypothetical protein N7494_008407 [Penicillium frequentans]|uniref:Rhodopsin domain-containing protein n=1 Tax=Penicillium frequentans TaxID=3151616 RepID=A0AAD6CUN2_9EURO|nr:hypothetical protein N7494_008407 [Penicillium glabrum]
MKELSASGTANLGASISMLVLSVAAVALRLLFRLNARQSITLSDAFIGLALLFSIIDYALLISYIINGAGPGTFSLAQILANLETGGATWGKSMMKILYICEVFFTAAISTAKLSILSLYHAMFGISITFRRFNLAMMGVVGFFWALFTLLFIFQCHPIHSMWNSLDSPDHCLATTKLVFAFELINFFVDVVILAMPPFIISQLHLPKVKKWSVCGVLFLGGMVCVTSIVRLYYIWNPGSAYVRSLSAMQIISDVQLGVAILCACLPTYAPLLRFFRRGLKGTKQSSARKMYQFDSGPNKAAKRDSDFLDLGFTDNKRLISLNHAHGSNPFRDSDGADGVASYTKVNRDKDLSSSDQEAVIGLHDIRINTDIIVD